MHTQNTPNAPAAEVPAQITEAEFQRRRREAAEILADTLLELWLAEHRARTEATTAKARRGVASV